MKPESAAFLEKARQFLAKAQEQELLDAHRWPDEAGRAAYLAGFHNPHLPSGSPAKVRITEPGAALEADEFEHPIDEADFVDQYRLPDQCNDNQADNDWHEK